MLRSASELVEKLAALQMIRLLPPTPTGGALPFETGWPPISPGRTRGRVKSMEHRFKQWGSLGE